MRSGIPHTICCDCAKADGQANHEPTCPGFLLNPHYLKLYELTAEWQDQALAALREHIPYSDYQQAQADFLNFRAQSGRFTASSTT